MNDLLDFIGSKLRSVYSKIYLENAPQGTQYPYVTYNLSNSDDDFQKEDFTMEVDIWDDDPDTTEIENITDNINKAFHRLHYYSANCFQADFYRVNRLMLEDNNPRIRRRQLRFKASVYFLK